MTNIFKYLAASLAFVGLTISDAHAYVDPGSGSVIVTTILGLIAAVGYTFRKYFYIARRKLFGTERDDDSKDE